MLSWKKRKKVEKTIKVAVSGKDKEYLKMLDEQHRYGYISDVAYKEARGKK